mgnify:CR=1 FL=1
MKLTRTKIDDYLIVEISGILDSSASGPLCDALVEAVNDGCRKLIVDLSGVGHLTHAGVRGLIVTAKLLRNSSGAMRICRVNRAGVAKLRSLGFYHLLKIDPTVEASMLALFAEANGVAPRARAA